MADQSFATFTRGQLRDEILSYFRTGLRNRINPATGAPFSETEIAVATAQGSRFWIEADAIDLVCLGLQARGTVLADQVRIDRASPEWLRDYHSVLWGVPYLPASGGGGKVKATATSGTVWVGSTTLGSPAAVYGTDETGLRYQVLIGENTPGSGTVTLQVGAVDSGTATNLEAGKTITWANPPLGAQATAEVLAPGFTGGTDAETDQEFSRRLAAQIRHKPASGNSSQMRVWAREATNSVEDAFVYACAYHAGSVHVAITQKRGTTTGPNARIPSLATLATVTAYLVPPGSPVVPSRAHVVVTGVTAQATNMILQLNLPKRSTAGYTDAAPWPGYVSAVADVNQVTDPTHFRVHSDMALPAGVTAPSLMVWNEAASGFEKLLVTSVSSAGSGNYNVTLSSPPATTIAVGSWISPDIGRRASLSQGITDYFDALGPGELINLASDDRAHRAARFPDPAEEYPYRAGAAIVARLGEALGSAFGDGVLVSMSPATPTVPSEPILGPNLLVAGKVAIYSL
ncbi:baseplate J/gp47 family protein [Sorangium sp. So ce1389]|uniref:baseplate J/gp47 family protein n=1 Tax=Sorangium sp. So ce1389 TaxID=3133336 RepID=UPI003F63AC4B